MPFSLARSSAANESKSVAFPGVGETGLAGECSSLHSDSRVLVPVSLPSDESKRRSAGSERFCDGIAFGAGALRGGGELDIKPNLENRNFFVLSNVVFKLVLKYLHIFFQ